MPAGGTLLGGPFCVGARVVPLGTVTAGGAVVDDVVAPGLGVTDVDPGVPLTVLLGLLGSPVVLDSGDAMLLARS